ncbi:iron-containing alcohol dehydrogenase [Microbacterium sp. 179-I 3D3 NHS]|uniref:iron-containing alcohol dehydrogenase n=1 Tax=Microbacterium sp. 179-I 3D3 NHS TaxID=3142382 RepID=UPI0039A0C300
MMPQTAVREELLTHDAVAPTIIGAGAAARALPRLGATKNALLVIDDRVHQEHPELALRVRRLVRHDPAGEAQSALLERVARDTAGEPAFEAVIGIGGGSVLDAAKLMRLALQSAASFRSARRRAIAYGVSLLPESKGSGAPSLALIPTTVGTGSEASAVACLHPDTGDSRRLVVGRLMRADTVVLDTTLTRSLTDRGVREGAAEILLRLLGSYVGSPAAAVPDAAAEELVDRVATVVAAGLSGGFDDGLRERLAVASTETHTGWALTGRAAYAAKHWYLANELSSVARAGKVPVTLMLLPAIWQRILTGDTRWGDAERLRRLWRIISLRLSLSADPVRGAVEWTGSWAMPDLRLSDGAIVSAARSCAQVWGGDRPALRGLTEDDVLDVYTASIRGS